MRDLLGQSIDNASEHHSVINARVGISEDLNELLPRFELGGDLDDLHKEKQHILEQLVHEFQPIKANCEMIVNKQSHDKVVFEQMRNLLQNLEWNSKHDGK